MSQIQFKKGMTLQFNYKNYRGETDLRTVQVVCLEYLLEKNAYYPAGTWLLRCFDMDREADRSFKLENIEITSIRYL